MTDNADNVGSTTDASATQAAAQVLKTNDTGTIRAAVEAAKAPPAKPEPAQATATQAEPDADAGAEPEEGDDATAAGAAPDETKPPKRRLSRWMRERLAETEARTEARIRAEYAAQQTQQAQPARPEPTNVGASTQGESTKTLADFNFNVEAYIEHQMEQREQRRAEAESRAKLETEWREADKAWKAKIDAFEMATGDGAWSEIEESPLHTDREFSAMTALFMGADNDLAIALHLARNINEARRIASLPPHQMAREVGKLLDTFEGTAGQTAQPAQVAAQSKPAPLPKKTTNAPPPPKTLSGAGKSVVDLDDPNISTADRIAAWRAGRK